MNIENKKKLEQKIKMEIQKLTAYTAEHASRATMPNPETDSNVKIEELAIQAVDRHTLAEARKQIGALPYGKC